MPCIAPIGAIASALGKRMENVTVEDVIKLQEENDLCFALAEACAEWLRIEASYSFRDDEGF